MCDLFKEGWHKRLCARLTLGLNQGGVSGVSLSAHQSREAVVKPELLTLY